MAARGDLVPSGRLADGTPFFGQVGVVAYDVDEDRVQCHLCGQWFRQVGGQHLLRRHGWRIGDYREAFRLGAGVSTCARGLTAVKSRLAQGVEPFCAPGRFNSDPTAARDAGRLKSGGFPRVVRSLADTRPDLVAEWHPARNVGVSPAALGMASTVAVWWCCAACGHEWQASIDARRRNPSCPRCRRERQRRSPHLSVANARWMSARAAANPLSARADLVAEWHPTRNLGLDSGAVSLKSHRRVWWRCSTCGHEWEAMVYARADGSGYPTCAGRRRRHRDGDRAAPA